MSGWIAIHRKIKQNPIYTDREPFCKRAAWLDILLEVNHTKAEVLIGGKVITCHPGESLNSLDTWAARWRWDKSKVRRFFATLSKLKMIVTKSETKTTRLTVCKWASYQAQRHDNDTITTRHRHDTDTTPTPNNNETIINNENNDDDGGKISEPEKPATPAQWLQAVALDAFFVETCCKQYRINENQFNEALQKFYEQKQALGELSHKGYKDFRQNFYYWLAKAPTSKPPTNGTNNGYLISEENFNTALADFLGENS